MVEPVHDLALAKHRAVGRVQVLGRLAAGHLTCPEAAHAAAGVRQREHEPRSRKPVHRARAGRAPKVPPARARPAVNPLPVAATHSRSHAPGAIPDPERLRAVSSVRPRSAQIRCGPASASAGLPQVAGVERRRRRPAAAAGDPAARATARLGRALLVLQLDAVAVGQPLDGGDEVEPLGLDHKPDVIAALSDSRSSGTPS